MQVQTRQRHDKLKKVDYHLTGYHIFVRMDYDGGVEESKQSLATGRTHTEIMRSLGYDPPEPEQKKPKTVWQQMVENFP